MSFESLCRLNLGYLCEAIDEAHFSRTEDRKELRTLVPKLNFILASLLVWGLAAPSVWAAAIKGEQPEVPAEEERRIKLKALPAGAAGSTIMHFSVLPTESGEFETRILVQRKGGRDVCLSARSSDVISRSYRKTSEEPLSIQSLIRGQTSGHTGQLVGSNERKVFIEPDSPEYYFKLNECFTAGDAKGCFVADLDDCDVHLDELEEVCVGRGLAGGKCSGADHASAVQTMKKMIAVGKQAVLVTEAGPIIGPEDVVSAPEVGGIFQPPSDDSGGDLVSGPTVSGPLGGSLVAGGGGDDLTVVPNLIGLSESEARDALIAAMMVLRNVAVASVDTEGVTVVELLLIRPAFAQNGPQCDFDVPANTVCTQFCRPNAIVPVGTPCDIILASQTLDTPEPSTFILLVTGLLLVVFVFGRPLNVFRAR